MIEALLLFLSTLASLNDAAAVKNQPAKVPTEAPAPTKTPEADGGHCRGGWDGN